MNRTYTIEHYLGIIHKARKIIPGVSFSTDIISGFPSETYDDHLATLEVMREVRYDGAYMFKYSPREGTKAYRMNDDVDEATKSKRLTEIIDEQQKISYEINHELIGTETEILVEGFSRKSKDFLSGRTDTNKVVIIPNINRISKGDYVRARINKGTSGTLFADVVKEIDISNDNKQKIA